MTMNPTSCSRAVLPALLLVSGFCGISYEILYAKLLGNLLGNQFMISASVLMTFLLGIGVGTLMAHRFVRWLWAIEAGIGLYAALLITAYPWVDRFIYSDVSLIGTSPVASAGVAVVLLVAPAFLVGCSVPLFAAYLSTVRSTHAFSVTYGIYNIGAAITALAMEFLVLRSFGLRAATLLFAALNGLVALALFALVRTTPIVPPPRLERLSFARLDLVGLALASIASAIFQLLMIKITESLIGPFNETFALVLATVLGGLALGSLLAARLRLRFETALLLATVGVVSILVTLPSIATGYAALYRTAAVSYPLHVFLKLALVVVPMGLPAIGFGATIPALLHEYRDVARESGQLLFVSSMANVVGFLLMAFVLHRLLDYGPLLLVIAFIAATGVIVRAGLRRAPAWIALAALMLALVGWKTVWNESLLYYGYRSFISL